MPRTSEYIHPTILIMGPYNILTNHSNYVSFNMDKYLKDKEKSEEYTETSLTVGNDCKVLNAVFYGSKRLHYANCRRFVFFTTTFS